MVEREDEQAGRGLQDDGGSVEQKRRTGLLEGDQVEEPVHQLGAVPVPERVDGHPRQAGGDVDAGPDEDPALDHLRQVGLERREHRAESEAREEKQGEHDHGLYEPTERDRVDELLHGDRRCECEQTHDHCVQHDRHQIAALGAHDLEQPTRRRKRAVRRRGGRRQPGVAVGPRARTKGLLEGGLRHRTPSSFNEKHP